MHSDVVVASRFPPVLALDQRRGKERFETYGFDEIPEAFQWG